MRKTIKFITSFFVCAILCTFFFGCSSISLTSDLLQAPRPTGEQQYIQNALNNYVGHDIILKYPRTGNNRSAIILVDLNNDSMDEAVMFYSKKSETGGIHFVVMTQAVVQKDDEITIHWSVVYDERLDTNEIDQIAFVNFDDKNTKQIFLGTRTYTKDKVAQIYSFNSINSNVTKMFQDKDSGIIYSDVIVQDFDNDFNYEILALYLNSTEQTSYVTLYDIKNNSLSMLSQIDIDGTVTSYDSMKYVTIDEYGHKALVFDGYKGNDTMITEIVCCDENLQLYAPCYDPKTGTNEVTQRPIQTVAKDINNDFIYEIPFVMASKNQDNNKQNYFTLWQRYNWKNHTFSTVTTTIINNDDNYYLNIPNEWTQKISFQLDQYEKSIRFYTKVLSVKFENSQPIYYDELVEIFKISVEMYGMQIDNVGVKYYIYHDDENNNGYYLTITDEENLQNLISEDKLIEMCNKHNFFNIIIK